MPMINILLELCVRSVSQLASLQLPAHSIISPPTRILALSIYQSNFLIDIIDVSLKFFCYQTAITYHQ